MLCIFPSLREGGHRRRRLRDARAQRSPLPALQGESTKAVAECSTALAMPFTPSDMWRQSRLRYHASLPLSTPDSALGIFVSVLTTNNVFLRSTKRRVRVPRPAGTMAIPHPVLLRSVWRVEARHMAPFRHWWRAWSMPVLI